MSENGTVPLNEQKPSRTTRYYVGKEGLTEAFQINDALDIARENYTDGPGDMASTIIAGMTLGMMTVFKPDKIGLIKRRSARNFFVRRFPDEIKISHEIGMPKESIANEAGIFMLSYPCQKMNEADAIKLAWNALEQSLISNHDELKRIYDQNPHTFSFENRLSDQNIKSWLTTLSQNRDTETGKGVKEYGVSVNRKNGEFKKRERMDVDAVFDVQVVSDDMDKGFEKIIENDLISKALLIKGKDGMIEMVRLLVPHLNNDEEQARGILRKFVEKIPEDNTVDTTGTRILRRYKIKDIDKQEFGIYDAESSYILSSDEERLINHALSSFDPRMNLSVFLSESWLAFSEEKSAYICVGPNTPREINGAVASGLQFAFLPKTADLKRFNDILEKFNTGEELQTLSAVVKKTLPVKLFESLNKVNRFMKSEIERAQKGMGTVAVLDTYLPGFSRKLFGAIFKRQDRLISKGSFQASSVNYKNEPFNNVTFTTALNISTSAALGIGSYKDKKILDLRIRTDRKFYDEALKSSNYGVDDRVVEQMVAKKVKNFRASVAIMSMIVSEEKLRTEFKDSPELPNKIAELQNLGRAVLASLNE